MVVVPDVPAPVLVAAVFVVPVHVPVPVMASPASQVPFVPVMALVLQVVVAAFPAQVSPLVPQVVAQTSMQTMLATVLVPPAPVMQPQQVPAPVMMPARVRRLAVNVAVMMLAGGVMRTRCLASPRFCRIHTVRPDNMRVNRRLVMLQLLDEQPVPPHRRRHEITQSTGR